MDGIHITEVLMQMEVLQTKDGLNTFSISWVRSRNGKGGQRGSIKTIARAVKGTSPRKASSKSATPKARRFKSFDGIPIRDIDTGDLLTPKFTHIVGFNGQKVIHYGR